MIAALNSSAIDVVDLEIVPLPVTRMTTVDGGAGGFMVRTAPGQPDSVDIILLDADGADLSQAAQRKLERIVQRQEFRRAFPGEIGDLTYPARVLDAYVDDLLRVIDLSGVQEADIKVVVDCANGVASLVLPTLLGRVPVDVLTVNGRLDSDRPTETAADRREGLSRLGELVASSRADFGVRFDPVGERLSIVDETGMVIDDDRALLVFLDLVAAERGAGRVALPVTTTRVAEQVCRFHGVEVAWVTTASDTLVRAAAEPGLDRGRGRARRFRGAGGQSRDRRLRSVPAPPRPGGPDPALARPDRGAHPTAHVMRRDVDTPWAIKGQVMRAVMEAAAPRVIDTTDGVRVVEDDGRWALVLPDPAEAVTHLWAEAESDEEAGELLDEWAGVVARARR